MQISTYNIVHNILNSKCQKYTAVILDFDYSCICTYTVESYTFVFFYLLIFGK